MLAGSQDWQMSSASGQASAHLIEASGEQIEGSEDTPIGPQIVLLHHLLVLYLEHSGAQSSQPFVSNAVWGGTFIYLGTSSATAGGHYEGTHWKALERKQ